MTKGFSSPSSSPSNPLFLKGSLPSGFQVHLGNQGFSGPPLSPAAVSIILWRRKKCIQTLKLWKDKANIQLLDGLLRACASLTATQGCTSLRAGRRGLATAIGADLPRRHHKDSRQESGKGLEDGESAGNHIGRERCTETLGGRREEQKN